MAVGRVFSRDTAFLHGKGVIRAGILQENFQIRPTANYQSDRAGRSGGECRGTVAGKH